ncbi:MAG: helix-turn-helix domain-containing protein, partial [Clostridium sp.]|nr:helix-turn-helix domain-containing protein [Clostridium sp.]
SQSTQATAAASIPDSQAASALPPGDDLASWIQADKRRREQEQILLALRKSGGNRSKAAELLGVSRSTLWRKLRLLGLQGKI